MNELLQGQYAIYMIAGAAGLCILLIFYVLFNMVRTVVEGYKTGYSEAVAGTIQGMFLFITPQQLLTLKLTTAFLAFLTVFILAIRAPLFMALVAGFIAASGAFYLPEHILKVMYRKRLEKFNDQLVDALLTLSNGLRSGLNFQQALGVLVQEMPAPISQEFTVVLQEIKLGEETSKALNNLVARVPDEDLAILVAAINIARGIGGNLAEIFDNIAGVIRERKRIEGRIKSLTAQGQLQAIVMALAPLAIVMAMYFIDSSMVEALYTTIPGWIIIFFVAIMDYVGYRVILKIVTIDV